MTPQDSGQGADPGKVVHEFAGTPRFEVRRQLGQGGMGVVYEAWDRERRLSVALKTLREIDPTALYQLKNEFRSLRGLQHPNLVSLGELIEDAGCWFYTMELVDGVDFLRWVRHEESVANEDRSDGHTSPSADTMQAMRPRRIRQATPLVDFTQLRGALGQLAQGLSALHEAGKVHRDVKPSNVLVDSSGRLVLLDFGLVFDMSAAARMSGRHVVGTPEYMAPEQATGQTVGPAADWYSVGVLLFESLCGRAPFEGAPLHVLLEKQQKSAPAPSELVDNLPRDLEELACGLLSFDPEARPSGRQVLRALGVSPVPRSYPSLITQTSVFVGRERENQRLEQAFAEVASGACVCVAVCGESGMGKSTLVRHFVRQLEQGERATVLSGACYENELVPYTAVDGAMDDLARVLARIDSAELAALLPRHVELLARMFPVLARVEAIARSRLLRTQVDPDPHEQRARAFEALRRLLVELGLKRPLVLAIDDVQWADLDSVRLLQRLLAPPDPPRLLVLLTSRTRAAVEQASLVAGSRIIDLAPLDPSAARDLSRQLAARTNAGSALGSEAIAAEAGGHPFLIQELVRYAALSGKPTEGVRVDDAIRARAAELAPSAQRLLELLSVAGAPLAQAVLRIAAGLEPAEFTRQRSILCAVNLARIEASSRDNIGLYHARVGDAMRGAQGVDQRALHAQLAVAFESSGVAEQHPELVVHHLEMAGEANRAADYARRAAERAAAQLAFERAAALFRTALRIGSFDRLETHQLRMALGHALVYTGRGAEAAEVFLEAADHDDPVIQLDCRRLAAEQLLISGRVERGLEVLERLLADIGTPLPRTPAATMTYLLWERLRLRVRGLGWKPRSVSQVTHEVIIHLDAHRAASHGLSMVDNIRGALFNTRHLRMALNGGDIVRIGDAIATEAVYHAVRGGRALVYAMKLSAQARELGERANDARLGAFAGAVEGTLAYLGSRFREAEAKLTTAVELLERVPAVTAWELNNCRLFQLFALRFLGSVKRARALSDRYLDDARSRGDSYFGTCLGRTAVWVQLAAGSVTGARDRLEQATWFANSVWFQVQDYYQLEAQSQIALYEDEADATFEALDPTFTRLNRSPMASVQICRSIARWQRATMALACKRMPAKQAIRIATDAAKKNEKEGISYASTMAEVLYAAAAQRAGRDEVARTRWQRAIACSEAADMADYAAAARFRLGTLIGGDEGAELIRVARAWARSEEIPDDRFFDVVTVGPRRGG